MTRQHVAPICLVISLGLLILGACSPGPPDSYDWCYSFDFTDDNAFGVAYGNWQPGTGYVTDDLGRIVLSYGAAYSIYPSKVLISATRIDPGDISVAASGNVFGITGEVVETLPAALTNAQMGLAALSADTNSSAANVSVIASGRLAVTGIEIYGRFDNPFGSSNCGDVIPTWTPNPVTSTAFPTLTPSPGTPIASATPTDTPTQTNTPTNTPTTTPTPTAASCAYTQVTYAITYSGANNASINNGASIVSHDTDYSSWGLYMQSYMNIQLPAPPTGKEAITYIYLTLANWNGVTYTTNSVYGNELMAQIPPWSSDIIVNDQWAQKVLNVSAQGDFRYPAHANCVNYGSAMCGYTRLDSVIVRYIPIACATGLPTPTPLPSNTPTTTYTPLPSHTPFPTSTPLTRTPNPTFTPAYTPSATLRPSRTPIPIYVPPTPLPATSTPIHSATPNQTLTAQWEGTVTESALTATATGTSTGSGGSGTGSLEGIGDASDNISGLAGVGSAVSAFLTNGMNSVSGWWGQVGTSFNAVNGAWVNTAAAPMPGTPLCLTAPLSSELCAIYYILTYTLLSGSVGSLLVPVGTVVIDLYGVFLFIKLGRAIVARMTEIVKQ